MMSQVKIFTRSRRALGETLAPAGSAVNDRQSAALMEKKRVRRRVRK